MKGSQDTAKKPVDKQKEKLEQELFRLRLERDAYREGFEKERQGRIDAEKQRSILEQQLIDINTRLQLALEQLQKNRNSRFGRSSETTDSLQLQWLFDEAEVTVAGEGQEAVQEEDEATVVQAHTRKKHKKHDLTVLPASTSVLEVDHTDECPIPIDPNTGEAMVLVDKRAEDKVGFLPATTYIERHLFPVYAPLGYDGDEGESLRSVSYPSGSRVLKGVMVTNSLASEVMVQKFCDHLPLYRQQDIFARRGLQISRQSMAQWIIDSAKRLQPLKDLIHKEVLQRRLVNMDESPLKVLHEPQREADHQSYMMVQVGSGGGPPVVDYTYDQHHNANVLGSLIEGFTGVLQTDGLVGYSVAVQDGGGVCTHIGCFSHARRGFTALGKGAIGKESLSFIQRIGKLYSIEKSMRSRWDDGEFANEQAFVDERVQRTQPILQQMHDLAQKKVTQVLQGSELQKALNYLLNQWPRLSGYPHHFDATPDNNSAERFTRPFAIGKRQWLFANTASGAGASAMMYTLLENAKLSSVNPHDYLWAVLDRAPLCQKEEDWQALLPWNIDLGGVQEKKASIVAARPLEGRTKEYTIRGGRY